MKVGHYRPEEPRMLGNARRCVQEREDRRRHVLVACAFTLALSSCTDADSTARRPQPEHTTERTLTTLPPTTQPAATTTPPEFIVGIKEGAGLVIARSSDGAVVTTIVPEARLGHASGGLAFDRTGTIFYTTEEEEDCFVIRSVSVTGGDNKKFADGYGPAVSRDNRRIAWSRQVGCGAFDDRVFVQPLNGGKPRSFVDKTEVGSFGHVEWDGDSRHLYVSDCGADSCGVLLLNSEQAGSIPDFINDEQPQELDGWLYGHGRWIARKQTLVFVPEYGEEFAGLRYPMLEADLHTNRLVSTYFQDGRIYQPMHFDDSFQHMLIRRTSGPLYRWTAGKLVRIGDGFTSAIWYEPFSR